jgi:hypothetical protein
VIFDKVTATGKGAVKLAVSIAVVLLAADLVITHTGWTADHIHDAVDHVTHWAAAVGHWLGNAGQTITSQF